ncbi:MAG: hypothetical protein EA353_12030, partial [Puniceicoccaceae bacterium]
IQLPLSLSIQPRASLESFLCVLSGMVWFYAALQWPINFSGRRRLFFGLSILLIVSAAWVVQGHLLGFYSIEMDGSTASGFFLEASQRANFFALGGILTFAYAFEGVRHRLAMPLFGFAASTLCFAALYVGEARDGLVLYYFGVFLWLVWSLCFERLPRFCRIGLPLMLLAFGLLFWMSERDGEDFRSAAKIDLQTAGAVEADLSRDTLSMILDAPLSGVGLGNFSAVFPQYRGATQAGRLIEHPGSDFLWLAAEGGLLALILLVALLGIYFQRCRGFNQGGSAFYRRLALLGLIIFLGLSLVDVPMHHPGTLYAGLLFAALLLPRGASRESYIKPWVWRVSGVILCGAGLIWIVAGSLSWPFHSSVQYTYLQKRLADRASVEDFSTAQSIASDWIQMRPLDWNAYSQRAQLTLAMGGSRDEVAADFERARFADPLSGEVRFSEGVAWLGYDNERALLAWEAALSLDLVEREETFQGMLASTIEHPGILIGLARLSEIDVGYRSALLEFLRGEDLTRELRRDLAKDAALSMFTPGQRSRIVENWIEHGDLSSAQEYLDLQEGNLENEWWLRALVYKNQANFQQAVETIRRNLEVPTVPPVDLDASALARLSRQFVVQPGDLSKGMALLYVHLQDEDFEQALVVVETMLESEQAPKSLHYWKAECLYQTEEFIESWYALEMYLEQ